MKSSKSKAAKMKTSHRTNSDNHKKRPRKSNGSIPHDRQQVDRPRIQHDLFLSPTDDDDTTRASPTTPRTAAQGHNHYQSSSNNYASTTSRKKRKDPPKPPPTPPPAAIHHELFQRNGCPTSTTSGKSPAATLIHGDQKAKGGSAVKKNKEATTPKSQEAVAPPATVASMMFHNNKTTNEEISGDHSTTPPPPKSREEAILIRRTQKLCNAWARSTKGHLTFTELLQVDGTTEDDDDNEEEEPPVLLRPEQLPQQLYISFNADVFERTRFRMTNTGTFEQVLSTTAATTTTTSTTTATADPEDSDKKEGKPFITAAPPVNVQTSTSSQKNDEESSIKTTEKAVVDDDDDKLEWFEGSIPVYMAEDAEYLNTIQQWIRQNVEYFSAQRGDRRGVARGRVGIRCIYCRHLHTSECESYPGTYNGIHSAISQKFLLHFQNCANLPSDKRTWYLAALRNDENFKQPRLAKHHEGGMANSVYSRVAAQRIGLVQTAHDGLRFSRELTLGALAMAPVQVKVEQQSILAEPPKPRAQAKVDSTSESFLAEALGEGDSDNAFSQASDKSRCSDYFFLSIRQVIICHATETDAFNRRHRTGLSGSDRRKVTVGFAGVCCRWCQKKRVFPSAGDGITAAILGNLSTHFVKTCPSIPAELKAAFHSYKKFHAQQHASIQKSLRDSMVRDLWFRLRSNDRPSTDNDEADATGPNEVGASDDSSQQETSV